MGLFNSVLPFSLITWSQQHVSSGLASILIAMTPLFTVVVAHLATDDDKLTRGAPRGPRRGPRRRRRDDGAGPASALGTSVQAQFALLLGRPVVCDLGRLWAALSRDAGRP